MNKGKLEYSALLLNSTFSLCPNGTGPNTIRFWESLSYGSIPVLLSNYHKLPEFVDWDKVCIIYDDRDITNLYDYLKSISKEDIKTMSENCIKIYNKYFSKVNFTAPIDEYFKM